MKTFFLFVAVLAPCIADAQTFQPQFEVASVKPMVVPRGLFYAPISNPSKINISGRRITTRGALFHLAAAAYGLEFNQVASGPDWSEKWTSTEVYDIEAQAPGDAMPTQDQVRAMLQALLADRFQLKFHREPREMAVYNLVVGSGGPKIKPHTSGDPPKMDAEGAIGSTVRIRYTNFSIAEFIRNVTLYFDRPLLDKTGLTGGFDFTLEFTAQPARMSATAAAAAAAIGIPEPEPGLPIVSSIRGQLGLSVVPAKGPVEFLVIDHAQKPSAN